MPSSPNWKRFRELGAELSELKASGKWDEKSFRRILAETEAAIGRAGEGAECVLIHAEPEWLDRLDQPPPD